MSKITIDREVLEQAFDAIDPSLLTDEASAAIREALAQPQQEPAWWPAVENILDGYGLQAIEFVADFKAALAQPQQEPVAWMHEWADGERIPLLTKEDDRLDDAPKSVRPLLYGDTAPPAQQVAEVQVKMTGGNAGIATVIREIDDPLRERLQPGDKLYTSPPARQPLTVERIRDEASHCGFIGNVDQLVEFVRRIESGGFNSVEIDRIKHDHHPAFAFRECEDSHAGEPLPRTIAGVPLELFAQQIEAAMRYADAPLTHDQFVTLVLYLKARAAS